jgi:hypothetical protein
VIAGVQKRAFQFQAEIHEIEQICAVYFSREFVQRTGRCACRSENIRTGIQNQPRARRMFGRGRYTSTRVQFIQDLPSERLQNEHVISHGKGGGALCSG